MSRPFLKGPILLRAVSQAHRQSLWANYHYQLHPHFLARILLLSIRRTSGLMGLLYTYGLFREGLFQFLAPALLLPHHVQIVVCSAITNICQYTFGLKQCNEID